MTKPLVLITHRFDNDLRLRLPQIQEADIRYVKNLLEDESLLAKATALIVRTSLKLDKDFFKKAPQLKFLVTATSGFDHIDLKSAQEVGVRVFHVPETQAVAAAELTIAMIFNCARKWTFADQQLRQGAWERSLLLGRQVSGLNLGIIGLGRVGTEVAKRAQALGMTTFAYDPYIQYDVEGVNMLGFEELMRTVDVVSLHVPKTKETFNMIKKETLGWMNTEGILINMSRGDVVNEQDLIDHLLLHQGFSAGLDVYAKEPLAKKSRLMELRNICLTPHIGASTQEALKNSSQVALEKVLALLKGDTPSGELPPNSLWWQKFGQISN